MKSISLMFDGQFSGGIFLMIKELHSSSTSYMREVILEHRLFEHIDLQHGYLVNGIFRCAKKMVALLASIALHQNPLPSRQV